MTLISTTSMSPATILPPPSATWHYIYGIIRCPQPLLLEVPGIGGTPVESIPCGDLALLASPLEHPDLGGLSRKQALELLTTHQRVVEEAMHAVAVLPLRAGTVLPHTRLLPLLTQGAALFSNTLERLAGAVQLELVVQWDLERVFALISAEPAIVALRDAVAALPPPASQEALLMVGQAVKASLDRRRSELSLALAAPLRELARDSLSVALADDSLVLSLALLVDTDRLPALEARVDEIDALFGASDTELPPLLFRLLGPMPPYSFATVEVELPTITAISAARELLGLPEQFAAAELRPAYRRAAARLHPDLNPGLPDGEARMAAVARAYRLLHAIAGSRDTALLDLRPAAVAATLLLKLCRQDEH